MYPYRPAIPIVIVTTIPITIPSGIILGQSLFGNISDLRFYENGNAIGLPYQITLIDQNQDSVPDEILLTIEVKTRNNAHLLLSFVAHVDGLPRNVSVTLPDALHAGNYAEYYLNMNPSPHAITGNLVNIAAVESTMNLDISLKILPTPQIQSVPQSTLNALTATYLISLFLFTYLVLEWFYAYVFSHRIIKAKVI